MVQSQRGAFSLVQGTELLPFFLDILLWVGDVGWLGEMCLFFVGQTSKQKQINKAKCVLISYAPLLLSWQGHFTVCKAFIHYTSSNAYARTPTCICFTSVCTYQPTKVHTQTRAQTCIHLFSQFWSPVPIMNGGSKLFCLFFKRGKNDFVKARSPPWSSYPSRFCNLLIFL